MSLKKLQNEAQKIRMTPAEKAMLKSRIFKLPTRSPYQISIFSFQFVTRAVAVVLILSLGSGGVVYAAEGSLPGQPLYPVKVNVEEPVEVALAPTPSAKASVYAELAQTRVEEAETLASQGDLDATTTQEISQNFNAQVQNADAQVLQVAVQDPAAAADIQTSLSASLETHSAILAQVGSGRGLATAHNSNAFAREVLASAVAIGGPAAVSAQSGASASSVSTVATNTSEPTGEISTTSEVAQTQPSVRTFASFAPPAASSSESSTTISSSTTASSTAAEPQSSETQARATDALMSAEQIYDSMKDSLDATTTAQIDAQFGRANTFITNGDYANALRVAVRLSTLLEAEQKLHADILPLLQFNINMGGLHRGSGDENNDQ